MQHSHIKKIFSSDSFKDIRKELKKLKQIGNRAKISRLPGSYRTLFASNLLKDFSGILLLLPDIQSVSETFVELNILGHEDECLAADNLEPEHIQAIISALRKKEKFILVAPYDILKIKMPPELKLLNESTSIKQGSEFSYNDLTDYLSLIGYQKEKFIESRGEYSVRGSIIDFWSYSERYPCRLEFDGDFIESIRYFDIESQRSLGKVESVTLSAELDFGNPENTATVFDYLDSPLVIADELQINEMFRNEVKKEIQRDDYSDLDDELKNEIFEGTLPSEKLFSADASEKFILNEYKSEKEILSGDAFWVMESFQGDSEGFINLNTFHAPSVHSNYDILFKTIGKYLAEKYSVCISVENELQLKRMKDLLAGINEEFGRFIEEESVSFEILPIREGFLSKTEKLLVLSDYQIFDKPYRTRISKRQLKKKSKMNDLSTIQKGDYIVHESFGIGRYIGLETIKIGMVEQESIKIQYAGDGIVYVNMNYLSLVKKYSSAENVQPQLSVIGSNEWSKTKSRVKTKIKEAARDLINIYAKRKAATGFSFSGDSIWQKELEASFFYEDTPDQEKVTEEVKTDMESCNPMDRLVCGDVGFGKTEIAVRAAFKAVSDNKQVALLVPTTILAEQHFNTFINRLNQFPVKVHVLSRFQSAARQKETIASLKEGKIDIIIGTHRLLSKDVEFKDLGLLIIDEEHRFGVMAKEKLKLFKAEVDTLTLTATPIPRTLNLSLLGARDLSLIATPPPNRQPIITKVEVFDIQKIRKWILDETGRQGQIFFVHDRVQSIRKLSAYIQRYIPEVKIGIAHGQMKPAELEDVIYKFLHKEYDMLLATKIIESGIDIPNVNTIIINRADRFGLAELHQLRGRVGRSDRKAFAYFIVPSLETISKKAIRRLAAVEEYSELGEGFNLAMRDLEIRGAGNLLGTEQSGAVDAVGFEMYVKLLDEAVEELKLGEFRNIFSGLPKAKERSEPSIDTYFEIGIPNSFMPDQSDRLNYYRLLFSMKDISELKEIEEEMTDRFGRLPEIIIRTLLCAKLRYYASIALFERVIINLDKITVILPKAEKTQFYEDHFKDFMQLIMTDYQKSFKFVQVKETMKTEMTNTFKFPEQAVEFIIEFSAKVAKMISP